VVQEGALYLTHSCGRRGEVVGAMEDPQQTYEVVDEVEVAVGVLQLQHHHRDFLAVSEPAACPSDVSF